jgi:hypothetical protein
VVIRAHALNSDNAYLPDSAGCCWHNEEVVDKRNCESGKCSKDDFNAFARISHVIKQRFTSRNEEFYNL